MYVTSLDLDQGVPGKILKINAKINMLWLMSWNKNRYRKL